MSAPFIFYFLDIIDILLGTKLGIFWFFLGIHVLCMLFLSIGVLILGSIAHISRRYFKSLVILFVAILSLFYSIYLGFEAIPVRASFEFNQLWMALPFIHIIWLIYRKDWQFLIPFYRSIQKQKRQKIKEEIKEEKNG